MVSLSLIERLETIVSIIKNSQEAKFVIPIIALISILLILIGLIKKRFVKYLYVFFYLGALGVLGYFYHVPLLNMLDYLVENVVNNILFPNLAVYIFVLLVINIVILISILSNKVGRFVKSFNICSFSIMQILLFFIVKSIIDNKINVYEKLNVYTNEQLLVLIEFSMTVFVIWMILLMVIKLINKLVGLIERNKVNYSFTNLIDIMPINVISPNQVVINYELDENMELIEYVPIKKKEFRVSK